MNINHLATPRGSQHYNAKLTEDDIRVIRELAKERQRLLTEARLVSNANIAEKFGVTKRAVEKILSYATWRHVD